MKCPITKIENPLRNILAPALVFLVLTQVFAVVFYGFIFPQTWLPYSDLWRPMDQAVYWQYGMLATDFIYGAAISIIFVKITVFSQKNLNIFFFSLALFLISRFSGEIYNFLMFPYDFSVASIGIFHGGATLFFWAAISNKIFNIKLK
jgi:hypothetical protein